MSLMLPGGDRQGRDSDTPTSCTGSAPGAAPAVEAPTRAILGEVATLHSCTERGRWEEAEPGVPGAELSCAGPGGARASVVAAGSDKQLSST